MVITFYGQMASGKDSTADYLADIMPGYTRLGFATAVKAVFMDTFRVTAEWIEVWKRRPEIPPGFNMPVRQCLQFIGDGFRKIQSDIWIDIAFRNKQNLIISDGRHINEARATKDRGGYNVLIWRPNFENDDPNPSEAQIRPVVDWFVKFGLEGPTKNWKLPPDSDMTLFDYFLKNDGTLDDLKDKTADLAVFIKRFCATLPAS